MTGGRIMTGGKICRMAVEAPNLVWLDVRDPQTEEQCGVWLDPDGNALRENDQVRWLGSRCYWTPSDPENGRAEVPLERRRGSKTSCAEWEQWARGQTPSHTSQAREEWLSSLAVGDCVHLVQELSRHTDFSGLYILPLGAYLKAGSLMHIVKIEDSANDACRRMADFACEGLKFKANLYRWADPIEPEHPACMVPSERIKWLYSLSEGDRIWTRPFDGTYRIPCRVSKVLEHQLEISDLNTEDYPADFTKRSGSDGYSRLEPVFDSELEEWEKILTRMNLLDEFRFISWSSYDTKTLLEVKKLLEENDDG